MSDPNRRFVLATATVPEIEAEISRLRAIGGGTAHLRGELEDRRLGRAAPVLPSASEIEADCRRMARSLLRGARR